MYITFPKELISIAVKASHKLEKNKHTILKKFNTFKICIYLNLM